MTKTTYAAFDKDSIYALGETPEAAIANARDDARDDSAEFDTAEIDERSAAYIRENGWNGMRDSFDVKNGRIILDKAI